MVNGAPPSELSGPLATLWRSVYRKAAALAETRTGELLRDHVYLFHRRNLGVGEDTGPFVDESGDTMTGTLQFSGPDTISGGAIRIFGSGAVAEARLYGAEMPAYAPGDTVLGPADFGVQLQPVAATYLVALRWYRTDADPTPTFVRLWDSTTPGTPLLNLATPTEWVSPTVGWKEHRLAVGTEVLLVAGRTYALAMHMPYEAAGGARDHWTGDQFLHPTPDPGLTFVANCTGATGTYPGGAGSDVYVGLDGAFRTTVSSAQPAETGAIRLPNGLEGAIGWRNGTNSGDHTLTVNAEDELVFDGVPLGGGTAEVTVTGDDGVAVVESPENTFALTTQVSADADNALELRADGLYATGGAVGGGAAREEFAPAAAATTVTLAATPTEVLSVSRNGVEQSVTAGDYSVAGAVVTFSSAFVAGERVGVVYETGGGGGGGGSGGALALLAEHLLGTTTATITFSGIAGTYRTLRLVVVARSDQAGTGVTNVQLRCNSDSGASYHWQADYGMGTTAAGISGVGQTAAYIGNAPQASALANAPGWSSSEIPLYAGTTFQKAISTRYGFRNATGASGIASGNAESVWASATAVTRLDLTLSGGSFVAGSYAALYGLT